MIETVTGQQKDNYDKLVDQNKELGTCIFFSWKMPSREPTSQ